MSIERTAEDTKRFHRDMEKLNPATKHTPGPWQVWEGSAKPDGECFTVGVICEGPGVDHYTQPAQAAGRTLGQAEANARLIAAAPELLEACERALTLMEALRAETWKLTASSRPNGPSECSVGHYAEFHATSLRAAIAKARGES